METTETASCNNALSKCFILDLEGNINEQETRLIAAEENIQGRYQCLHFS